MAGSSAPVLYWAVRTTLCIALRCQEVAIPNSDVARQEALNGAAVEPFEGPCQSLHSLRPLIELCPCSHLGLCVLYEREVQSLPRDVDL
jgi:hypothetical protein